jgi:hypothetical protein
LGEHESLDSRCLARTRAEAAKQARLFRRAAHSVRGSLHRQKPCVASGLVSECYMADHRDALLDATADQVPHVKDGVHDAKIGQTGTVAILVAGIACRINGAFLAHSLHVINENSKGRCHRKVRECTGNALSAINEIGDIDCFASIVPPSLVYRRYDPSSPQDSKQLT